MNIKYVVGGVIIAVFMVWAAMSFMSTAIKYVSLDEVAKTSGVVQLMGKINFDAVEYDAEHSRLVFEVTGLEEHTKNRRMKIVYTGMVPGNFDQATSVVARGRYVDSLFVADELLVKCPSKYQGMAEGA